MAARYSIPNNAYVWAKAFVDEDYLGERITGLAMNYAETVLAIATDAKSLKMNLFFLDPLTGGRLFDSYQIELEDEMYI
jgi:hypothetical protein